MQCQYLLVNHNYNFEFKDEEILEHICKPTRPGSGASMTSAGETLSYSRFEVIKLPRVFELVDTGMKKKEKFAGLN